jgi:hypothetical protein
LTYFNLVQDYVILTLPARLGELVMLHRLAIEESESDTMSSRSSISDIEKLDLSGERTPSMSTVFSDQPSSTSHTPRSGSPARSESPSRLKAGLANAFKRRNSGSSSDHEKKKEDGLARWLRDGNVVYKSVGLGLMDLVVGGHLVRLAVEKQVGTQIDGF